MMLSAPHETRGGFRIFPGDSGRSVRMKIVLKHLTKEFPSRNKKGEVVVAVNDFDFEIPDGKLIGLLGPSGCGKSTALNLICGLEVPTRGQIFFGENDVTKLSPENRGVGMVFQNYALYPHLTVRQNIRFPLENLKGKNKLTKEVMEEKVVEAAKLVQIEDYLERKPNQLSGGQQQRVAIARALVKRPQVLLLDEPLSNLDARLRLQTREEIRRIQTETLITTIFVTHDQEEAMSISDLIVVMKSGVIQQIGKPQEVYNKPVNLFVAKFLGTPAINVFEGRMEGGKLYIGGAAVLDRPNVPDQEVYVGIRPEGFVVDENGPFELDLKQVEVMGRDTSVVAEHSASLSGTTRAIVSTDDAEHVGGAKVHFSLKKAKVHLFRKDTEELIED
jgi:multiple sugar transport system ATP-binding protein